MVPNCEILWEFSILIIYFLNCVLWRNEDEICIDSVVMRLQRGVFCVLWLLSCFHVQNLLFYQKCENEIEKRDKTTIFLYKPAHLHGMVIIREMVVIITAQALSVQ